jgi:hypothetical protein
VFSSIFFLFAALFLRVILLMFLVMVSVGLFSLFSEVLWSLKAEVGVEKGEEGRWVKRGMRRDPLLKLLLNLSYV